MTPELTIEAVRRLIGLQLGKRDVSETDRIVEDLGAESADIVNIVAAAEDKYRVALDEAAVAGVRTAADLFRLIRPAM